MNLLQQLMLPQILNAGLETAFNHLLKNTAHIEPHLRKLNGKCLLVTLDKVNISVYFLFSTQQIDVLNQYEVEVDCAVQLSPTLLLKKPEKSQLSQFINDQSIRLQGDLQVLQDFVALVEFLQKDPAELLSHYVGDVVAHSAVTFLKNLACLLQSKFNKSQQFWGERLTEEYEVIAPSLAIEDFCQQVKTLEKQTALLEQKFKQILA